MGTTDMTIIKILMITSQAFIEKR